MNRSLLLPVLAGVGLLIALGTIAVENSGRPARPLAVEPAASPFHEHVAGTGLVEAATENIAIGTPVSGIVETIYVRWGDHVNAGDPLFKIDDRDVEEQLVTAVAKVKQAEADLAKAKYQRDVVRGLKGGEGISVEDKTNRALDVNTSEAALEVARAQVESLKIEETRRTIRAPISGHVLQIKVHVGELAESTSLSSTPLMLLGAESRLNVRVDVDEYDAWRIKPDAPAMAYLPGNPKLGAPLSFVRIEPYVVPKVSLTGESTERIDMRVMQVIYSFDPKALPVAPGQRLDVFIDTSAHKVMAPRHAPGSGVHSASRA